MFIKFFVPQMKLKSFNTEEIFQDKKIFVLNDPVFKIKDFCFLKKDKSFDERFEKNNIIMVGRLTFQKNFDLMIDAYNENNNLKNNYKLFVLGAVILRVV